MTIKTLFPPPHSQEDIEPGMPYPMVGVDNALMKARDWAIAAENLVDEALALPASVGPAGRLQLATTAAQISAAWSQFATATCASETSILAGDLVLDQKGRLRS